MRKLVLAGLVAVGAVAYRRLSRPTSAPTLRSVPTLDPAAQDVLPGDDQGGSSPDEAASDLASEAESHAVTLPDQPLEEVDLTEVPDPPEPSADAGSPRE